MSDYLENVLVNAVLRNTAYSSPATVYLALFTADPTDAGTGTEVTGGAYARQTITFGAPTNGVASTNADVTFPVATAAWGAVTHFGIYDASSTGNLLFHGAFATSKTIATDDQFKVIAGNITVTLA